MENFNLELQGNWILFILFFICLIGFSIYVYRRTNPPVPNWLKKILTFLRAVSLVIILFILFEPILNLSWNRIEKPVIAVLLDSSASMSLTDDGKIRSEKAKAIMQYDFFQTDFDDKEFEFYQFSDNLAPLHLNQLDSVQFNRDGTDITKALKMLSEKSIDSYLQGIVLITDGIHNLGENPVRYVEEFDTPIFTIAIGKAMEQKDIVISKITSNQITYANNKVPVDVTVQAYGYPDQRIEINLLKDTEVIDSKYIEVGKDIFETRVRLHFTPIEPGFQKYRIQIPVLENELTSINNQKNFYIKVLRSKMKLLFISGGPDADFKFIKRSLEADQNIDVDYWVLKNNREFYQGNFPDNPNKFKPYDCIILQNFPRANALSHIIIFLKNVIEKNLTPLLFVAGNGVQYQSLVPLQNYLPIASPFNKYREFLVVPRLTANGLIHPVSRIVDDEFENQKKWQDMPPIYLSLQKVQLSPGSEVLIDTDPEQTLLRGLKQPLPLVIVQKMGQQKSMAIIGYGIWRWDLLMWGIGKSNEVFTQFLSNSVRWLITKEESKPVRIHSDQEIYRNGQQVSFTAEVYYEDYQPLDGAEVKLTVQSKLKTYEILFSGLGDGKYEGSLQALEGGDYRYEGTATFNNRLIGSDQGQFSVEDFNLEFLQTKMDKTLLQQLALKTGGKYLTEDDFQSLEKLLNFPTRNILESREMQLWNKLVLLIVVIIFLSTEWFLRKRSGML